MSNQDDAPKRKQLLSRDNDQFYPMLLFGILALALILAFADILGYAATEWTGAQYSHGWLIPLFAGGLLWLRYKPIGEVSSSARWVGVGVISLFLVIRVLFGFMGLGTPDMYSFIPVMLGVVLLSWGWQGLRWAGPPIAFLFFMFPLPQFLEVMLLNPLQTLATECSTYVLVTLGVDAFREGNVIQLENMPLGVIDQCSGLRMVTIFIALCLALAMIVQSTWWERALLIVSSVPIALIVNITRISITGLLMVSVNSDVAHTAGHDLAGWLMMPMALGLMWVEWRVINTLFIEPEEAAVPMNLRASGSRRPAM